MKTHIHEPAIITNDAAAQAFGTRKLVRERAVALAFKQGRTALCVTKSDWEQAKKELEAETVPTAPLQISVAESEQWDPIPGSTGHKVHVQSGEDEDDEGRSDVERLVIDGVRQAGREQSEQADRALD